MPPRQSRRKAVGAIPETSITRSNASKANGVSKAYSTSRATKRKVSDSSPEPDLISDESDRESHDESKTTKRRKASANPEVKKEISATEEPKATPKNRKAGKAKTKAKAEDAANPLAERTAIATLQKSMYIGAHVSSAGGVQNSTKNAVHIGANAFALFLKSQFKWKNPPITPDACDGFRNLSKEHKFEVHRHCLPHGSYLVNLAQAETEKADQAYDAFLDDLQRCESLGILLYNFHPGSTNGDIREAAIKRIAAQLNKAHKATSTVVTVLENMAGQGNVVGSTFEDLRDIIALIDDKSRVGVCIDTCHAFAAGYDLRSPEAFATTMSKFDEVVGMSYLRALHINDSKAPFESHRDLHANIGTGYLGLRAFHNVVNYDAFAGLPMILETPIDRPGPDGKKVEDKQIWADEIKLLERLIGMDPSSEEFTSLEKKLHADGASERAKIQEQVDRKSAKDAKKTRAKPKGKKKKKADEDSDDGSD
ncbi:AP endonuclease [Xylaria nigripes]|nr:AP endonuclease [Xylaria nigripes]